jgi:2-polyprenyl-6-methoxyphenol hydroxylase-like FAD-dependent oxidoreductase
MSSIVIVGAGIGGCTTYLFLKKYLSSDISVHIYESYPAPPYLSNLNRSKPTASLDLFVSEGDSQEATKTMAGSTPNVTTAIGGWLGLSPNGLRVIKSLDHGIYERVKAIGVEVDVFGAQVRSGRMLGNFKVGGKRYGEGTLLVARAAVHDAVLKEIKSNNISFNKKVKRVIDGDTTVRIEFEDGESVDADLVIGADGVWGKTREAIPECARFKPEYE